MHADILYRPSFAMARVQLAQGERLRAEPGAMMAMSPTLKLDAKVEGGLLKAFGRALGGENLFQSTYTAEAGPGEILLAPSTPGDVMALQLENGNLVVQSGSWLAGSATLEMNTKFGGARSFFGGEGLFMLNLQGTGLLLITSFGAIHKIVLDPNEEYIVDTGHIVAFDASTQYSIDRAAKGLLSSMTSGEGFVCRFRGPGEIYVQTRNLSAFAGALVPFLPRPAG